MLIAALEKPKINNLHTSLTHISLSEDHSKAVTALTPIFPVRLPLRARKQQWASHRPAAHISFTVPPPWVIYMHLLSPGTPSLPTTIIIPLYIIPVFFLPFHHLLQSRVPFYISHLARNGNDPTHQLPHPSARRSIHHHSAKLSRISAVPTAIPIADPSTIPTSTVTTVTSRLPSTTPTNGSQHPPQHVALLPSRCLSVPIPPNPPTAPSKDPNVRARRTAPNRTPSTPIPPHTSALRSRQYRQPRWRRIWATGESAQHHRHSETGFPQQSL